MMPTDLSEVLRLRRALEAAEQEAAMFQAEAEDAKAGALEIALEAAQDRAETEQMRRELAEARKVSEAAHYLIADPGCVPGEDETCPEYFADGGESPSGVEFCSHVQHRYATWADRYAREHLDEALRDIRQRLAAGEETPADLVAAIDDALDSLRTHLNMEIPESSGGGVSAYTPADLKASAAERDASRERWESSDGVEAVRVALNDKADAQQKAARLERELRDVLALAGVVVKTPDEWQADMPDEVILDRDGWRGPGGRSWEERITLDEFLRRRSECTVEHAAAKRAAAEASP